MSDTDGPYTTFLGGVAAGHGWKTALNDAGLSTDQFLAYLFHGHMAALELAQALYGRDLRAVDAAIDKMEVSS